MKIIFLMGSPNRTGSTGILVEEFTRGAEEAGHSVELIDAATPTSTPAPAVYGAALKVPAYRRTTWR